MHLSQLHLTNLRCHPEVSLALPPGLNLFLGPNGAGKTTLLEAVMLLATGRSPRTNWLRELIRQDTTEALAAGDFSPASGPALPVRVRLTREGPGDCRRELTLGGAPPASLGELMQRLPVVFFEPDDLGLVKAGARERRRFLNLALCGLRPLYLEDLLRYRRALQQRNALLKLAAQGRAAGADLAPWTAQLVRAGAQLMADRQWLIESLAPRAAELYRELSGDAEPLELRYRPDVECREAGLPERMEAFCEALEETEDRELRRGATQVGPHRDDLLLVLGGRAARDFASQGQQRTAALSLKLAQAQVLAGLRAESPLVLLDDCLSELDEHRRAQVLGLVSQFDQILLTTAGPPPLPAELGAAQLWQVTPGHVEAVARA